jgi:glycine/D-amino acid oxidase-like deaminating enzyme
MADPLAAVAGLADLARTAGATFRFHAAVTGLRQSPGGWEVATSAGCVACRQVVIAAGLWSAELAARARVHLPITHRPIHVSVTEVTEPLVGHLCYHTTQRLTLKQVARGNVVIGGGWGAGLD